MTSPRETVLLVERDTPFTPRWDRVVWLRGAVETLAQRHPGAEIRILGEGGSLLDEAFLRARNASPVTLPFSAAAIRRSRASAAYLLYNTLNRFALLGTECLLLAAARGPILTMEPKPLRDRVRNSPFLKSEAHADKKGIFGVCFILDTYRDKAERFHPDAVLDTVLLETRPLTLSGLAPFYLFSRLRKLAVLRVLWRHVEYHALLTFLACLHRLRFAAAFRDPEHPERQVFRGYVDAVFPYRGRVARAANEGRHVAMLDARAPSLEIGADDGVVSRLNLRGRRFTVGAEYDPAVLLGARACLNESFDHLVAGSDLYRLPFADGSFRTIVLLQTVTHIERIDGVLAELSRVLAPGGRLAFSALGEHYHGFTLSYRLFGRTPLRGWLDRRRQDFLKRCWRHNLLSPDAWKTLMDRYGLAMESYQGYSSAPMSTWDNHLNFELGHSIGPCSPADTRYTRWLRRMLTWCYYPFYLNDLEWSRRHGANFGFVVARKPGEASAVPEWPACLVCPECRGTLLEEEKILRCAACRLDYPVTGGIPVMNVPEAAC